MGLNFYNYGWRNYDPAIGRWVNVDPLLNDLKFTFDDSQVDEDDEDEVYEAIITNLETAEGIFNVNNLNPYSYGYNNPVSFDDPDGRCPWCVGAALGALTDYGLQVAGNLIEGKDLGDALTDVDGKSILLSAATGATGAGLASKFSKVVSLSKKVDKANDIKNNVKKVEAIKKAEARAEKLSKTQRSGKDFTKAGKEAVKDVNKAKNNGKNVCESCGTKTKPATQSKKGVKPSGKETQVDHKIPKSKGGSGTPDNGQVLCRDCNIKKSDKVIINGQ